MREEARESELKIVDVFFERNLDKDDVIGLMCALRKYDLCNEMLAWLEVNKQADIDKICDKVFEIYDREELKLSK